MRIAVTVDLEKDIGFADSFYGINEELPFILDVFRKNGIKATFFVSGQAADCLKRGGFFREIVNGAHEIASHGYMHADYRKWKYEEIENEILKSKNILEEHSGAVVSGYRAPQFLLNDKVVRAVKDAGFSYDSSLPDVAGISAARILGRVKTDIHLLETIKNSGLKEFAIDSIPVVRVPHGLLWTNLVSINIYKLLFGMIKKDFMMFYMHPFDLVSEKNRLRLDMKRKIFYLKNQAGIRELLEALIRFWISRGVQFVKCEDEVQRMQ